jgi:hypothetical protein
VYAFGVVPMFSNSMILIVPLLYSQAQLLELEQQILGELDKRRTLGDALARLEQDNLQLRSQVPLSFLCVTTSVLSELNVDIATGTVKHVEEYLRSTCIGTSGN